MGAWFTEYFARVRELPKLHEYLDDLFGEDRPRDPEEEARQTSAAARAWNRQFAALGAAQEAARAAAGQE